MCIQRQARFPSGLVCTCPTIGAYVVVRTVRPRAAAMVSFTTLDANSAALTGKFSPRSTARLPVAAGLQLTGLIF